jgi:hypothetical protein
VNKICTTEQEIERLELWEAKTTANIALLKLQNKLIGLPNLCEQVCQCRKAIADLRTAQLLKRI